MPDSDPLDGMIDAAAALLDIAITPEWRDAIRTHLVISLTHARNVAGFELPDDAEPAPVFTA